MHSTDHSLKPAKPKTPSPSFPPLPAISTMNDTVNQATIALSDSAFLEAPGSELEDEGEVMELAVAIHESVLTYVAEKSAENSRKQSSSMIAHRVSQQATSQRIHENGLSDAGQLALAITEKTQPEQNPYTKPQHVITTANSNAQAKIGEQD